jgi:uncharacterized Tic20 family protein
MTPDTDVHDMVAMWRTIKMLSPMLLLLLSGLGGMAVWYLKKMVDAIEAMGRAQERILSTIESHGDRIERLEDRML